MKTVAFIFARGGSKGLPGKNLRTIGGKPMIAWSIEHALAVERIGRVIVSTDSDEIAIIAKQYGAEVPFIRPAHLATDSSPEFLSWRHGLEYLKESVGSIPEIMVSLPATSPLRSVIDINNCLDKYEKTASDVVITMTDSHRSPYFNMVSQNSDGTYRLVNSSASTINRRQDAPVVYDMATVCYVVNSEFAMSHDSIFEGRVSGVHVPTNRAIDVDTLLDFQIAEMLLSNRGVE
jgi:N-acylneuraminate cytidylyltransferase